MTRGAVKNPKSCHERALGLLAVRARSRRELETRLLGAGFEGEEVDDVLERLEGVGLIDDEAFARQVAEHRFGVRREGARAVAAELRAKGVGASVIASVVDEWTGADGEEERAQALAVSRVSRLGAVEPANAFNRLSGLLMRRGFSPDVARRAARRALGLDGDE